MTDNKDFNKGRYFEARSIVAKFDGDCPYCSHGIRAYEDNIANGPKGWGHAGCVNAKWHYNHGGGHPLCRTHTSSQLRIAEDWSKVTCKKCLGMEANKDAYEAAEATVTEKHGPSTEQGSNLQRWLHGVDREEDKELRARGLPPIHENRARKQAREYADNYNKTGSELSLQAIVPTLTEMGVDKAEAEALRDKWVKGQ
jgi:hypothetical protein